MIADQTWAYADKSEIDAASVVRARRVVAAHARNNRECGLLLAMLDIVDPPGPPRHRSPKAVRSDDPS